MPPSGPPAALPVPAARCSTARTMPAAGPARRSATPRQAALQRLDAGVYGDCVDCGQPIALERLRVQPAAERCAACQAARERLRRA